MNDPQSGDIPAELQALMDAEIEVAGLDAPSVELQAREVIARLPGVVEPSCSGARVMFRYDTERITIAEIRAALESTGLRVLGVLTAAASPVGDAMHH